MDEYKPNSHKFKEEQKQKEERDIKKVVTGSTKLRKKSELSKLTGAIVAEDASNVKSYIMSDVIIPAAKKLISDIVKDGIEMLLYGTTGGSKKSSGNKVSYRSYYDRDSDRRDYARRSDRFDFEDIEFDSRGDAEAVRTGMEEVIERYGFVTVADMYDMADRTAPYTANKYGWTSVRNAEVVRVRDGYILKLSRAVPIER